MGMIPQRSPEMMRCLQHTLVPSRSVSTDFVKLFCKSQERTDLHIHGMSPPSSANWLVAKKRNLFTGYTLFTTGCNWRSAVWKEGWKQLHSVGGKPGSNLAVFTLRRDRSWFPARLPTAAEHENNMPQSNTTTPLTGSVKSGSGPPQIFHGEGREGQCYPKPWHLDLFFCLAF